MIINLCGIRKRMRSFKEGRRAPLPRHEIVSRRMQNAERDEPQDNDREPIHQDCPQVRICQSAK